MVIALDSVQPVFTLPPLETIPDDAEDKPQPGRALEEIGPFRVSSLVFGAAAWSHFYSSDTLLESDVPLRTIRLALRYGIRSFDTSPYYGVSEIVLGTALKALEPEFPRASYQLMTKCGRYGPDAFDYTPATLRRSVARSLARLHTPYLDVVYLHDTEFVAPQVGPRTEGVHAGAVGAEAEAYGLGEGQAGAVRGAGDERILQGIAELRKMQDEGLVKRVGITGLPLPTLLRLSILATHTAPFRPLDAVLSYGQLTLQNATLLPFLPAFARRAQVAQVLTASRSRWACSRRRRPGGTPRPRPCARRRPRRCGGAKGGRAGCRRWRSGGRGACGRGACGRGRCRRCWG
ncbi:Aldo/keto reductase family-domain-containing protein [Amylostereum chailletii]|nr:Aldo/keto reductase family-domain-containing protein [Amylostereum chailletii]